MEFAFLGRVTLLLSMENSESCGKSEEIGPAAEGVEGGYAKLEPGSDSGTKSETGESRDPDRKKRGKRGALRLPLNGI